MILSLDSSGLYEVLDFMISWFLTHLSSRYKPIFLIKPEETETAQIILAEAKKCLMENNATNVEVVVAKDFFEDTVQN